MLEARTLIPSGHFGQEPKFATEPSRSPLGFLASVNSNCLPESEGYFFIGEKVFEQLLEGDLPCDLLG
jgi:hypothetical protein